MSYFLLVSLLSLSWCFLRDNLRTSKINFLFPLLICTILISMPALRGYNVGTDTWSYIEIFDYDWDFLDFINNGFEPLFSLIILFLNRFDFQSYFPYFLVTSIIFISIVYYSFYKIFLNIYPAILSFITISFIYFSHFNILRQSLAVSIFLIAMYYFHERKYIYFVISLIIGIFFHYSFVVVLGFFATLFIYQNNKRLAFLIFASIFVFFFKYYSILDFLSGYLPFLRISNYIGVESSAQGGSKIILLNIIVLIFYFSYKKIFNIYYKYQNILEVLFIYMLIFNSGLVFFNIPFNGPGRVICYFFTCYAFLFDFFYSTAHKDYKMIALIFITIFGFAYMFIMFALGNPHGVFPYEFNSNLILY